MLGPNYKDHWEKKKKKKKKRGSGLSFWEKYNDQE